MVQVLAAVFGLLVAAVLTQLVLVPLARRWLGGRSNSALEVFGAVIERHPDMRLLSSEPPKLGFLYRAQKATFELVPPDLDGSGAAHESGLNRHDGVTAATYFLARPAPRLLLATKDPTIALIGESMAAAGYPAEWIIVATSPSEAERLLTTALRDAVRSLSELWLDEVSLSLHDRRLTVQVVGWLTRDAELVEEAVLRMNAVAGAICDELDRFTGDYRDGG